MDKIKTTAQKLTAKGTKVIVSNILPREGISYTRSISETNAILTSQLNNVAGVTLMNNDQFAYGSRPNSNLFATRYNSGQQYVSIHLNQKGLAAFSKNLHKLLHMVANNR